MKKSQTTSMFKRIVLIAIILVTAVVLKAGASTPQPPEVPHDYVVDLAGIFTKDTLYQLNTSLQDLERRTTAQVLVLTVQSLDGQSIEEFSFNTKEKWKLGQKGKDNGVLIVVALKDRKYRFEVGYGLESALPDSLVGMIGRQYLVPNFKSGDYSVGISRAIDALNKTILEGEGRKTLTPTPAQDYHTGDDQAHISIIGTFLMVLLLIPILFIFVRCPLEKNKQELRELWGGGGDGAYGSGGFGGGGFGGFGGGSFGGGGGGSGGGASGGW